MEFVLCFPILMVLFLFAVQFSYIMIAWQVVHYSAYMGARSAMTENVLQRKSKAEKVVKRILAVVSASPTDSKDAKDRAKDEYSKLDGWGWLPNTKFLDQQVDVDISMTNLDPRGVAVFIEAEHLCMTMRGARAAGALTKTSALRGCMRTDAKTRNEVMLLLSK